MNRTTITIQNLTFTVETANTMAALADHLAGAIDQLVAAQDAPAQDAPAQDAPAQETPQETPQDAVTFNAACARLVNFLEYSEQPLRSFNAIQKGTGLSTQMLNDALSDTQMSGRVETRRRRIDGATLYMAA